MKCKTCKGEKIIIVPELIRHDLMGGVKEKVETCPDCKGTGIKPKKEK